MNISNINKYLSTFNLVLIFIGYQMVTTLFLPNTIEVDPEDWLSLSRGVTLPYRGLALAISIVVIILNWRNYVRLNVPMKLFLIFWGLLIIRIIFDLKIRTDITVDPNKAQNTFIYVFLMCLVPVISVFKSIKSIDYYLAFKWLMGAYVILIPISYYNNPLLFSASAPGVRLGGNIAFNTIAFGHYGGALMLLALFWNNQKSELWRKVISYLLMVVGVFIMLRAGSRGPLITLLICLMLYYVATKINSIWTIGLIFIALCVLFFNDLIFEGIRQISPVLADRMTLSGNANQYEELTTGRSGLYQAAIDGFMNNPVFGQSFAIFSANGSYSYSHNIIFDAFMGLGLFGGILFVVIILYAIKNSFLMIMHQHEHWWSAILCLHFIISSMFSGCFYHSCELNVCIILVFYSNLIELYSSKSSISHVDVVDVGYKL